MNRILLLLCFCSGCAHGLQASIDTVEKGAAGVGVVIDESVDIWAAGVEAIVAFCKAKGLGPDATPQEREQCMGLLAQGDEAEPALQKLRDGYDQLADALELLKQGADEIEPFLEAAEQAVKQ